MSDIVRACEEVNRVVREEVLRFESGLAGYRPDADFLRGTYRRVVLSISVLEDGLKRLHAARKALKNQLLEVGRDG